MYFDIYLRIFKFHFHWQNQAKMIEFIRFSNHDDKKDLWATRTRHNKFFLKSK